MRLWAGLGLAGWIAAASTARAQPSPYIGFAYPAGGRQGTVIQVKLGGQNVAKVCGAIVTGNGVTARVLEYRQKLGPQEITLLREQMAELEKKPPPAAAMSPTVPATPPAGAKPAEGGGGNAMTTMSGPMMGAPAESPPAGQPPPARDPATQALIARIKNRLDEYVQQPASSSISNIVLIEVKIAPDAEAGRRELRLVTPRGVSNPLVFVVGQEPETCRKPMITAAVQILGKENLALRKRPKEEEEVRITLPCTMNGQIASGEVNKYRFQGKKGQRLVVRSLARQLIPYIADAVPGWFQPVMVLWDGAGREVAYDDDYRFKPDPTMLFEVPKDGDYVLGIYDAIYRGREDFIYRITIGETPFLTGIFPLGGPSSSPPAITMKGWNLDKAELTQPAKGAPRGIYPVVARQGAMLSNPLPFAVDTLPECLEREGNNSPAKAQKVGLPVIVNGRIDRKDDCDVFQFDGKAGDVVVAEVMARRLDSPLDSELRLTGPGGKLLALSDDVEDLGSGLDTHHADSYLMAKLPADGAYCVALSDASRSGSEEHGYRLRLGPPRPDFALRVVPSYIALRGKSGQALTVHAIRRDGFSGPIRLALKDPPPGFTAEPVTLPGAQTVAKLLLKTNLKDTPQPVDLVVEGRATIGEEEVAHAAVPAEDRMQAFLWKHLVPAQDLKALVFDPNYEPPPKRVSRLSAAAKP